VTAQATTKDAADFDFFIGSWKVAHRRLKERLASCTEWQEFGGTSVINASTGQWSIWWLDGRYPGSIDTPVVGRFENGVGIFYAEETFAGKPIRVRFLWTMFKPDGPRWEQAFSPDAGATWETNWFMDFTRTGVV